MFITIKMHYFIVISAIISVSVSAFSFINHHSHHTSSCLSMAGMGMSSTLSKKKGKKNKKGMGKTKSSADNKKKYDVAKSMIKSEKLYDDLMAESMKALQQQEDDDDIEITTEYIIAARVDPSSIQAKGKASAISAASDWVPVAQICIQRPIHLHEEEDESDELNPSVRAGKSVLVCL